MKQSWKNWTKASRELLIATGKTCIKGLITAVTWIPGAITGFCRECGKTKASAK